jgi:hypothetical protein
MKLIPNIVLACLAVSCSSREPSRTSSLSEQAELKKANILSAQLHENMTFQDVSKIIPLVKSDESKVVEHGGVWFDVPIGHYYYIQVRFQHPPEGKTYEDSLLNLPPRVKQIDLTRQP